MTIADFLTNDTHLVALLYLTFSVLYLLIIPGMVYFYLNSRWYVASSFERVWMYFLMFFFFPGMLVLSPFLNFRPKRRNLTT
ncbi:MAG: NAD(P)H-quinone oxidoreductase subunit L [cyanobacterium endosymbiont of Rhopalodia musculus]|uniref:NAD(P)H-quinone oxidoreductase subunit L n=1 Tax=cyanobacterium endosymbiont of Epithemia clementina EcSB TaxID=3034674 RepID=UPI0038666982